MTQLVLERPESTAQPKTAQNLTNGLFGQKLARTDTVSQQTKRTLRAA